MNTHRPRTSSQTLTPVLMAGLVLALPLAVSAPAAMPARAGIVVGVTGVSSLTGSQERAEYLARCVSEAARQFCAAHVTPMFCDAGLSLDLDAPDLAGVETPQVIVTPTQCLAHVTRIDLPPPPEAIG